MTYYLTHSDNWDWKPPVPAYCYKGWWVENDDGEPMIGPFVTEAEAQEELEEMERELCTPSHS